MIMRIRALITGTTGLPGVMTTYWTGASSSPVGADAVDVAGRVRAFWDGVKTILSPGVTITLPGPADVLDHTNGNLQYTLSIGSPANVVSTGANACPRATMLLLKYNTALVINGRFLRGRSFIGPPATATITNGGVTPASNTTLLTAAASFGSGATASALVVWHRPTPAQPTSGAVAPVVSFATSTEFAVLRSRRD